MKFDVKVCRVEYREHVFRVEEDDSIRAAQKARELADDHDFNSDDIISAHESVTEIRKVGRRS